MSMYNDCTLNENTDEEKKANIHGRLYITEPTKFAVGLAYIFFVSITFIL